MRLVSWGVAAVMGSVVLSACATTTSVAGSSAAHPPGEVGGVVDAAPFALYTHCGIHELAYEGRYYTRAGGPLSDGQGNPPAGWDNPYQRGSLVVESSQAFFSDAKGHRETFALRPGATSFETICS